jgi:hypothetical protein
MKHLRTQDCEFVIIDHSPGLSYNPGVGIAWALDDARADDMEIHLWFVAGAPWWEPGLIVYETNVYTHLLRGVDPTLIVNRVGRAWLGKDAFKVGEHRTVAPHDEYARLLEQRLLSLPIWMAARVKPTELHRKFLLPGNLTFAILGEDVKVQRSMHSPEDYEAPNDSPEAVVGEVGATGNGIDLEQMETNLRRRWGTWATDFLQNFVVPAVADTSEGRPFHQHVRTALVDPLLARIESKNERTP